MESIAEWDHRPAACFALFVRSREFGLTSRRRLTTPGHQGLSEESALIYTFMFSKFEKWMAASNLMMSTVSGQQILRFLQLASTAGTRDLNSRIAYRYLRLLERCYQFLEVAPNPAQSAVLNAFRQEQSLGRDQPMIALTAEQLARFVDALPSRTGNWKRRRDRAMQLVMLFGGLRVAEVIGCLLDEVGKQPDLDGSLTLSITPEGKHRSSYEHQTMLRKGGADELLSWIQEREQMQIPGELVFPANLRGDPLNKTTVYRQVKDSFVRAGLDVPRLGGRTLRNTFAVQELEMGASDAELTEHLGLALERSTKTYSLARASLAK